MGFSNISEMFPDMRTAYVRFDGTPNRMYAYLAPRSMGLECGNLVVVPVKNDFALGTVVSIIDGMTDMANRLVVCKVHRRAHIDREIKLRGILTNVQNMHTGIEELRKLLAKERMKNASMKGCDCSCLNDPIF